MRCVMRWMAVMAVVAACGGMCFGQEKGEEGLLFYVSGEKGAVADVAGGGAEPTVVRGVTGVEDGAKGKGLRCAGTQVLAWWAGGNMYAQRGTLAFYFRSREAVGPTAFPIFRAAFADSSTWDMAWLRVDYNGQGFDAFVTDAALARTRVSVKVDPFPKANEWTHLAVTWDERVGIKLYVNGKLAGEQAKVGSGTWDVGLDQFGPFSRIISPHQVQSDYNFVRGGDIDEVRVYDRMLPPESVAKLAAGEGAGALPAEGRTLSDAGRKAEWWHEYGWDGVVQALPATGAGEVVSIRKVEVLEAYDLKRWWWKGNDGIRETTWPGVYNRSRLPGRTDYFVLPDWDCYSTSGKAVTFVMPGEAWNWVEMTGSAHGRMEKLAADAPVLVEENEQVKGEGVLFERAKGMEKTVHRVDSQRGGKVRFVNTEAEEPIGEIGFYDVTSGREPAGSAKREFVLHVPEGIEQIQGGGAEAITGYIRGRFPADERAVMTGGPGGRSTRGEGKKSASMPLVHVVIPDTWDDVEGGLDGVAIELPAMKVAPTHGELFGMNVRVKDPLWAMRDMADVTFGVKPGEAKTLWLDLRDRMLPKGAALYVTVAGAGGDFGPGALEGAKVRLVFKPVGAARAEHEADRFTQARDCYAMLVEEHPKSERLNMWVRFERDLRDLLRVNPEHERGREYAWAAGLQGAVRPAYVASAVPAGVPGWAWRQTELLGKVKSFVDFYIDKRQIADGEFGGGLSDDTDLTNTWVGVALMGAEPEKLRESLHRELEACYANGMFTNGLPTIQVDELHSYEEGINCLAENMILDFGNPQNIERAMETQKGMERITGVNGAGHRHFKTSYYSATKMAEEYPWGYTKGYSYLVLQPGQLLVDYNGESEAKKVLLELADGFLAHRAVDGSGRGVTPEVINFKTDEAEGAGRRWFPWHVLWTAWEWTGDRKYLGPIMDGGTGTISTVNANALDWLGLRETWGTLGGGAGGGRGAGRGGGAGGHVGWQLSGDKKLLENLYASQVQTVDQMNYINTEGSLWIDRVSVPITELQRARLGGVALVRNSLFPGHTVSWEFEKPANERSVGILIPDATRTSFKVIAYNLEEKAVKARMTGWNVDPGVWEMTQGVDGDGDDVAEGKVETKEVGLERSGWVEVEFGPRVTTVLTFKLKKAGVPYWERPDLAIGKVDLVKTNEGLQVMVHNVGTVDAPEATLRVLDKEGKVLGTAKIPAMKGVRELRPSMQRVGVLVGEGRVEIGSVEIDSGETAEITKRNNWVEWGN